ncbi:MAG: hypothetical protein J3K34DRAFT_527193 [Monoraphidium minutum]|nr:MAG: hypothetical protein J3K34DRAFT_527193 [Monoraphidium minutum]
MGRRTLVIAVVGDAGAGKTSLITAACHERYGDAPPPVLPAARFPAELFNSPEDVGELLVVDTSSRPEDYAATEAAGLARLKGHWLPEVARLNGGAPVVVAVCKDDRKDRLDLSELRRWAVALESLISAHPSLEVSIRCSAKEMTSVGEVFYHALKAVLYPKGPLLEPATGRLTTPCVKALLRIFLMCDDDQDGALSDDELNAFQVLCFGQPLSEEELDSVKAMVAERMPEGLGDTGLLFPGFMYLHTLFLTRGRLESTWAVLRAFGYDQDLRISDAALAHLPAPGADAVLELSPTALAYLAHAFDVYDSTRTGVLSADDLEHMFNRAPVPIYQARCLDLWNRTLVPGANPGLGPLGKEAYLTRWRAFALQARGEPRAALEQMMYLGLGGRGGEGAAELFEPRPRRRRGDRRADVSSRSVLHCAVFGGLASGKSSLVQALAGRPPGGPLAGLLSAAGCVAVGRGSAGGKEDLDVKTLVLTEVSSAAEPSDPMIDLSRVDVAAVVYDSSDPASFAAAAALAAGVSGLAGEGLPVVLVAAKDDVGSSPELRQEVAAACAALSLPPPLAVSVAQGNLGQPNAFRYLAEAALSPDGHIPDTPARKIRRRNTRRAWLAAGAAVSAAAAGYVAYRYSQSQPGGGGGGSSGGGGSGDGGVWGRGVAAAQALRASAAAGVSALGSCCEPYHSGASPPPSAPDLVRARVSALSLGLAPFLAATCHPEGRDAGRLGGAAALGGARLERRMRREAALHARFKFRPLGMAHCEGDEPGTWVVAYVLEAAAGGGGGGGFAAGARWTVLEACRREGGGGGGGGGGEPGGRWLYYGRTRQLPQAHDAAAIMELIQELDPEALGLGPPPPGGLAGRRRMFRQGPRRLGGGGEGGGWYVDLASPTALRRAAEAAVSAAAGGGGARRRGGGGGAAAAALAQAQAVAGMAALGDDGVLEMDAYLEVMRQQGAPVGAE